MAGVFVSRLARLRLFEGYSCTFLVSNLCTVRNHLYWEEKIWETTIFCLLRGHPYRDFSTVSTKVMTWRIWFFPTVNNRQRNCLDQSREISSTVTKAWKDITRASNETVRKFLVQIATGLNGLPLVRMMMMMQVCAILVCAKPRRPRSCRHKHYNNGKKGCQSLAQTHGNHKMV